MRPSEQENVREVNIQGLAKWGMIIGFLGLIILFFFPVVFINAGERGVLMTFGKPTAVLDEGINFRIPFVQSTAIMNVRTVKYEAQAEAASRDLQDVKTTVALNYHLDPTRVLEIYRDIGNNGNVDSAVIAPAIQESVKAATAVYNAEELITERPVVKQRIEENLFKRLQDRGILTETLSLTDFKFSPSFTQAIEAKQVAQQEALQAENVLQKVKVEAEQAVASAQGQANATLTKANAEATALKIQSDALKQSNQVLTLRYIEKWNGQLPTVLGTNAGLLLPIQNLTG